MDIGGHSEYFTITKVLIGGKALFTLIFDAGPYSQDLHYRLIGTGIDTILDRSSSAVIALVANKVDAGKQYHINDQKNKAKTLKRARKQIEQRQQTREGTPYLINHVFEVSCDRGKLLAPFKDIGKCLPLDPNNETKDLEDLKAIIAEVFLDLEAVEAKDGSKTSVITLDREVPLLWTCLLYTSPSPRDS